MNLSAPEINTFTSSRDEFGLFWKILKQENNLISGGMSVPAGRFAVITFIKVGYEFFSLTFSNESS